MGGLGNQLFQIFTTIAYSIRYNRNFVFAYSEKLNIGVERNTYWNSFLSDLLRFTNYDESSRSFTNKELSKLPQYFEKSFQYHVIPEWSADFSFQLQGYFQSYLYFCQERTKIFEMIQLSKQKEEVFREFAYLFAKKDEHPHLCISMHFRLGDYKVKKDFHPVLSISYYIHALRHIADYVSEDLSKNIPKRNIRVLYFCEKEDNADVSEKIKILTKQFPFFEFVKVDDNIVDWKQMLLMSLCDHHIIANSTFSWWGAYLSETDNRKICYPTKWFGPKLAQHNVKDLFPISWTPIPCI
jgi:hypothetical protein